MPRKRLPDRRQSETLDLWHGGQRYHVTIGQYGDGRPGEVFAAGLNGHIGKAASGHWAGAVIPS